MIAAFIFSLVGIVLLALLAVILTDTTLERKHARTMAEREIKDTRK